MTRCEIVQELERQEADLEQVKACDEREACLLFNADSKAELMEAIEDEIAYYKGLLREDEGTNSGMDYIGLQSSQGMAVVHW